QRIGSFLLFPPVSYHTFPHFPGMASRIFTLISTRSSARRDSSSCTGRLPDRGSYTYRCLLPEGSRTYPPCLCTTGPRFPVWIPAADTAHSPVPSGPPWPRALWPSHYFPGLHWPERCNNTIWPTAALSRRAHEEPPRNAGC